MTSTTNSGGAVTGVAMLVTSAVASPFYLGMAGALGRPLADVAGPADPAEIWDGSGPSR